MFCAFCVSVAKKQTTNSGNFKKKKGLWKTQTVD